MKSSLYNENAVLGSRFGSASISLSKACQLPRNGFQYFWFPSFNCSINYVSKSKFWILLFVESRCEKECSQRRKRPSLKEHFFCVFLSLCKFLEIVSSISTYRGYFWQRAIRSRVQVGPRSFLYPNTSFPLFKLVPFFRVQTHTLTIVSAILIAR